MSSAQNQDSDDLAEFGYSQSLDRSIGKFASFAAGISYISILTGTFQLFYFGFGTGGPAYLWSWPLVFAGQIMVALSSPSWPAATRWPARSTTGPSRWPAGPPPGWPAG